MMESPQRTAGAAETATESPEVEAHGESAGDGPADGEATRTPSTRHDSYLQTGPKPPDKGSPKRRARTTAKTPAKRTPKASTKSRAKASPKGRDETVAKRHVFEGEGHGTPTDQRYCINSVSLTLAPAEATQET